MRRHGKRRGPLAQPAAPQPPRDSWWTVLFVDPIAIPLVGLLARRTAATPGQLTAAGGMLAVSAAGAFLVGGRLGTAVGTMFFQLSFLLDCMDGKLARRTGTATETGAWLGELVSKGRFVACGPAVLVGRYCNTGDRRYLLLAVLTVAAALVCQTTGSRLPGPVRVSLLARCGLRTRPVSEVEYSMAVCVIAPETGAYPTVIGVATLLLLVCELAAFCALVPSYRALRESPGSHPHKLRHLALPHH